MLECQHLLLKPWQGVAPGESRPGLPTNRGRGEQREILDADTGTRLGAVWKPTVPGWKRALGRPTLHVYETEDAAWLMTVRRRYGWTTRYEVLDADGGLRGTFYAPRARRAGNTTVTAFLLDPYPVAGMAGAAGVALADLVAIATGADGMLLRFAPTLVNQPFIKMVAFAAALMAVV